MNWQTTLVLMLVGHLIADYTLQGWLADGKQKFWWRRMFNEDILSKYRFDYIAALVCHSLYWSIFVCAPFYESRFFLVAILVNSLVHAIIDDLKANRYKINLIIDQVLHLLQRLVTFACFI